MHKDISYGIFPLRKERERWEVLLIRHRQGHWAFPKGHPEGEEHPKETAVRELKEETNVDIASFLELPPLKEQYTFYRNKMQVDKTVIYFAALTKGEVVIQEKEISDYKWMALEDSKHLVTFDEARALCVKVQAYLEPFTNSRKLGNSSS